MKTCYIGVHFFSFNSTRSRPPSTCGGCFVPPSSLPSWNRIGVCGGRGWDATQARGSHGLSAPPSPHKKKRRSSTRSSPETHHASHSTCDKRTRFSRYTLPCSRPSPQLHRVELYRVETLSSPTIRGATMKPLHRPFGLDDVSLVWTGGSGCNQCAAAGVSLPLEHDVCESYPLCIPKRV